MKTILAMTLLTLAPALSAQQVEEPEQTAVGPAEDPLQGADASPEAP